MCQCTGGLPARLHWLGGVPLRGPVPFTHLLPVATEGFPPRAAAVQEECSLLDPLLPLEGVSWDSWVQKQRKLWGGITSLSGRPQLL